ncbi:MAG: serine hydrolase domain-containing protein, partial [Longimicrobiales bacterium]
TRPLAERPRSRTTGLDSARLATALERAARLPRLHNIIVARHGRVVAEQHVRGPGPATPANVKSVSKSVLSTLIGIAIETGQLRSVRQPIAPFFEAHLADDVRKAEITVEHLLSMRSGLESTSGRNYGRWVNSPNWVRHALDRPLVDEPGGRMVYSTGSTHLLSAILTQATGTSTHAYAVEHLARPLDIQLPPWTRDPQGIYFGGNEMSLSPRALLHFGELYRNGGVVDGQRVLSRAWIDDSWGVYGHSRWNGHGYGYGWWARTSNGYAVRFAWGYGGQYVFIVPALELTAVFTSDPYAPREGPHNRELHRILDELLVPAAIAGAAGQPPAVGGAGATAAPDR